MLFQAKQKIVFIGDSITDAERTIDAGPFGKGYVNIVRGLLQARYPELRLTFVNKGIGGNTVLNLAERWQQDVIDERPDWLSVKIGINDAYRGVSLEEYRTTYHRLLSWTREEIGARLILMHPYLIYNDREAADRRRLDQYIAIVNELATEFEAVVVETQAAFDAAMEQTLDVEWAYDHVHPQLPGHAVIALAFLRSVGFTL